jgi:hypothetical protein
MRRVAFALALVLPVVQGCGNATAPDARESVRVTREATSLAITSQSAKPVFLFVIGQEMATRTDWLPCVEERICPPLAPGGTQRVAYPSALIPATEQAALVVWWHVRYPLGRPPLMEESGSIVVPLQ